MNGRQVSIAEVTRITLFTLGFMFLNQTLVSTSHSMVSQVMKLSNIIKNQIVSQVFEIEKSSGCSRDFVAVYDGASLSAPRVARACGILLPSSASTVTSTKNAFTVVFSSDHQNTERGFEAEIIAFPCVSASSNHVKWASHLPMPQCLPPLDLNHQNKPISLTSPGFSSGYYPLSVRRSFLIVSPSFTCIQFKLKSRSSLMKIRMFFFP